MGRTTTRTHNSRTRRCDGSRGFPSIKSPPQKAVGGIRTPAHVVSTFELRAETQILVFMLIQSLQLFIFFLVEKKNALTNDQIVTNRTKKQSDLKSPKHEWEE